MPVILAGWWGSYIRHGVTTTVAIGYQSIDSGLHRKRQSYSWESGILGSTLLKPRVTGSSPGGASPAGAGPVQLRLALLA